MTLVEIILYLPKKLPQSDRKVSSNELDITITRLGTRGDGIAILATGETLYIPFSAPGDRLRVSVGARRGNGRTGYILKIFEAADSRAEPVCPHFGDCGGCSLQHLQEPV